MATILIIDDNPTNRDTYDDILSMEGHTCLTANSGEEGLAKLTAASVDIVLCDLKLPNLDGLAVMELAHERHGTIPWILVTGHGSEEIAVAAIKQGAFNYLTKPVDLARLKATIESASRLAHANRENQALRRELGYDEALTRIIGSSGVIKQVKALIRQVADSGATVLIEGESGTGKELIADAVHALSRRSQRPLIKINTAAIPRDLLESELFGHERGAFTGALQQKRGKFELADTGSVFLDEIGEMPMDSQVKLLRVLQDGSFQHVGGTEDLHTNIRLICATNRNLKQDVLAGHFRMDLYYRLNVVNITMPPLRERREDIPLLTQHFIERLNRKHGRKKQASEELLQAVRRMDWPGNVRELENTVEKCFVLSPGDTILADFLQPEPWQHLLQTDLDHKPDHPSSSSTTSKPATPTEEAHCNSGDESDCVAALVGLPLDEIERRVVLATLAHCKGNKSKTARLLQIGVKTLYRKLESYSERGRGTGDET
jgi:DNA-binding NtrC family response regulator